MLTYEARLNRRILVQRVAIALLLILILATVIAPTALYMNYRAEARQALGDAKNAELALRMLSIEYYGMNKSMLDQTQPNGLAEGVGDKIRELSGMNGTVQVVSWDEDNMQVREMIYRTGSFVVIYDQTALHDRTWISYCNILAFTTG